MSLTSDSALQRLLDGNLRFVQEVRQEEEISGLKKLKKLALAGQKPFAIILTCADSRVPAELLFDQGLGDLFVLRVAGNVVAPSLLASMEFAATQFETPLILVMGHTSCGAIQAAIDFNDGKLNQLTPNLFDLMTRIQPAIEHKKGVHPFIQNIGQVMQNNVKNSMRQISASSPVLADRVTNGLLKIVGSFFDFETGRVNLIT